MSYNYLTYLPEHFDKSKTYPLLIFLHGAPQRGDNIDMVKETALPFELENNNFNLEMIVIAPQCPSGESWQSEKTYSIFVDIYKQYNIDIKRVYLTGFSMGGFGALKFMKDYPKLFAAVAPICSGGSIFIAESIKHIPMWFFHGKNDEIIEFDKTKDLYNELKKLEADVKLTSYENLGHDVWTTTYKKPELYEWLLSHHL